MHYPDRDETVQGILCLALMDEQTDCHIFQLELPCFFAMLYLINKKPLVETSLIITLSMLALESSYGESQIGELHFN